MFRVYSGCIWLHIIYAHMHPLAEGHQKANCCVCRVRNGKTSWSTSWLTDRRRFTWMARSWQCVWQKTRSRRRLRFLLPTIYTLALFFWGGGTQLSEEQDVMPASDESTTSPSTPECLQIDLRKPWNLFLEFIWHVFELFGIDFEHILYFLWVIWVCFSNTVILKYYIVNDNEQCWFSIFN